MRQPEGSTAIVRHQVVLEAADVAHGEPDPFGGPHFDNRRHESVLGHRDDELALRRRSASDEERAAHQKTYSEHAGPS